MAFHMVQVDLAVDTAHCNAESCAFCFRGVDWAMLIDTVQARMHTHTHTNTNTTFMCVRVNSCSLHISTSRWHIREADSQTGYSHPLLQGNASRKRRGVDSWWRVLPWLYASLDGHGLHSIFVHSNTQAPSTHADMCTLMHVRVCTQRTRMNATLTCMHIHGTCTCTRTLARTHVQAHAHAYARSEARAVCVCKHACVHTRTHLHTVSLSLALARARALSLSFTQTRTQGKANKTASTPKPKESEHWIKRRFILTDETLRYFRPSDDKVSIDMYIYVYVHECL